MPKLRALLPCLLALGTACSSRPPVRVLGSEAGAAPISNPDPLERRPRIGAPGGSGAGSRSVNPAQSGKETVGGLPAGSGSGPGRRG